MIEISTNFRNYILNNQTFYSDSIQLRKDTINRKYTFIYGNVFEVDYIYNQVNSEMYLSELGIRILREPDIQINYINDVESRYTNYITRIQGRLIDEENILFDLIPRQAGTSILYKILNDNFDLLTTDLDYYDVENYYYILNNFQQSNSTQNQEPQNNGYYFNGAGGFHILNSGITGINYKINEYRQKEVTATMRSGKTNIMDTNSVFTTSILGYNSSLNINNQNIITYEEDIFSYNESILYTNNRSYYEYVGDNSSRITNYLKPLKDENNNILNNLIYYPTNQVKIDNPETFGSTATYYGTTLRYVTQQENDITTILETMNIWLSLNALNISLSAILSIALGFALYSFLKRVL